MDYVEHIAHITCKCGAVIQVVNEDGNDLDVEATELALKEHYKVCKG